MKKDLLVKKIKAFSENPDLIKEPSVTELADLVVLVLSAVDQISEMIKAGRLDGKTPEKDKDYISKETALAMLTDAVNEMKSKADTTLSTTSTELEARVAQAIENIRHGKDGIVTEEEIEKAASLAASLIDLPDFEALMTEKVQGNGYLIRDALESLPTGEKLAIDAIEGLREELAKRIESARTATAIIARRLDQIEDVNLSGLADGDTIVWNATTRRWEPGAGGGGVSTFLALTDTPSSYSGQAGKAVVVNGGATGVEFQDFPAGSGDVTASSAFANDNRVIRSDGASKGVQASAVTLDDSGNLTGVGTVNTHTIPGGTGTFALTSQLHDAVTVTDSTSIDFTLTGQDITAQREALTGAITASKNSNTTALGSFTKAQLDAAVSDGNVLYVGDVTQYTDENAQDAVGNAVGNGLDYDDASGAISVDETELTATSLSGFTEGAQDAVGAMAANSTFINLTYSDATPSLTPALSATGTPSSSTYLRGDNTWSTIAGGGDVTKVGTPVNNQVGVWTGDGTIEGDTALTFDTTTDTLTVGGGLAVDTSTLVVDATNNRVGIGTASPVTKLHASDGVTPAANTYVGTEGFFASNSGTSLNLRLFTTSATAGIAPALIALRGRGTADSPTIVQSSDLLGGMAMQGWDGTTRATAAQIYAYVDGTPGASDMPGRLVFATTADGAATATDRIIIDSAGAIKPATDDAITLGNATNRYSDLYLAEGGTINWDNGDAVVTQTGNDITVSGITTFGLGTSTALTTGTIELGAASDTTISRVSAGVVAVEGNNVILANTTATRSMVLTASGGQPTTTSGCAAVAKVEAGTNDIDYNVLDFDATAQEYAFWNARLPDNYDGGTITARFVWTSSAGGAGGTVVWGIQALAIGNDDAIDAAYGTAQEVSDDWIANGDIHITSATSAITIAGTPAAGDMLMVRVYRDPADANDDLTGDARLMQVVLEYGINAYSE